MENPALTHDWDVYQNYCAEVVGIRRRMANDDVPESKKGALKFRLRDIEERLMPGVISRLGAGVSIRISA